MEVIIFVWKVWWGVWVDGVRWGDSDVVDVDVNPVDILMLLMCQCAVVLLMLLLPDVLM